MYGFKCIGVNRYAMEEANGESPRDSGGRLKVPMPYNPALEQTPLRSKEDIITFDKAFRTITADLPKPILLGSIMRLSELALPDWGIDINLDNRPELMRYAE